jgi:hypothetical protein
LVAIELPHRPSLRELRLLLNETGDSIDLLPFYDSLRELHLEEFRRWNWGSTDGNFAKYAWIMSERRWPSRGKEDAQVTITRYPKDEYKYRAKEEVDEFKEGIRSCQKVVS